MLYIFLVVVCYITIIIFAFSGWQSRSYKVVPWHTAQPLSFLGHGARVSHTPSPWHMP